MEFNKWEHEAKSKIFHSPANKIRRRGNQTKVRFQMGTRGIEPRRTGLQPDALPLSYVPFTIEEIKGF